MEYSIFSHDSERPIPPVSKKFNAKTLSFISLMIAPIDEEKACDKHTSSRQNGGSATPKPSDTERPATNAAGGESGDVILPAAGPRPEPSTPGAWTLPPTTALPPPAPPAYHHHQSSTCLHTSVINFPRKAAVEDVSVLTQTSTTASRIPFHVHQLVKLCFCILDPVSTVTVDNVDQDRS